MVSKKKKPRKFQRMGYRKLQRKNSRNRNLLSKEHQKWLKENNYKNVGWERVISLYQKIQELQREAQINDLSLEELFLEADRIGNKYFSGQEIQEQQQKIAVELNEIAEILDNQFPSQQAEVIDYSQGKTSKKKRRRRVKVK